ncbi:MAG: hypothetical protein KGH63_01415 [Candidatus Micrarchaeota archaeon]|nr:hypothetical protein [Candidatus Micrarchaeota archaeon]
MEALMLGALALSLLIIAAIVISRLQAGQADLFARRTLQTELAGLGQYADEICVLGEGNARQMELAPPQAGGAGSLNLTVSDGGRVLAVQQGNWSASYRTLCPAGADGGPYGAYAYLWYEAQADGSAGVRISPQPHP